MRPDNEIPVARPRVPSHHAAQHAVARSRRGELRAARQRAAHIRAARRQGRRRLAIICVAGVVVLVLIVSLAGSTGRDPHRTARSPIAHSHTVATVVPPVLHSSLASTMVIPGKPAALPLPRAGEGAVVVAGAGLVGETANERTVPVASVTKIMTAYLVLKDHPLVGKAGGPIFVMTAADHNAWIQAAEADDSNVEVKAGEHLDERQLLQALMIPSADNIANYLAVWDAGSVPAFVAKMNATARSLHLDGTHYADASGVNPGSESTAGDMARLAALAMENPVLRSITDELFIKLPVEGEIWNSYDPAVGVDGIIGVKSGFTEAAQTNLVTAAWRTVRGHRVLVICDVIDQPNSLQGDAEENEGLLNAVAGELRLSTVVRSHAAVGEALAAWSHAHAVVQIPATVAVVGWPGLALSPKVVAAAAPSSAQAHGWPAGSAVGTFQLLYPFGTAASEPIVLQSSIGPPPSGWKPSGAVR